MKGFAKPIAIVGAVFFVGFGLWAMVAPQSFFDQLATYPPYNEHFLHDIGAFQLGIGATLIAALVLADGLAIALAGAAVGSVAHAIAHVMDRDQGGKASDPWLLGGLALVIVVAAVFRNKELRSKASA